MLHAKTRIACEYTKKKYFKSTYALTLQGELDDLTQEHAKLMEANKMTMEECEREAREKDKVG